MPAKLKAMLMRLSCRQLIAALDGDAEKHDRIMARGDALCRAYNALVRRREKKEVKT